MWARQSRAGQNGTSSRDLERVTSAENMPGFRFMNVGIAGIARVIIMGGAVQVSHRYKHGRPYMDLDRLRWGS